MLALYYSVRVVGLVFSVCDVMPERGQPIDHFDQIRTLFIVERAHHVRQRNTVRGFCSDFDRVARTDVAFRNNTEVCAHAASALKPSWECDVGHSHPEL